MSTKYKILALVAFLVLDVVLFYFIKERNKADFAEEPIATPSPTVTATPSPTAALGGPVSMVASRSGSVFLIHRGNCSKKQRPLVQVSANGGSRFREMNLPTGQFGAEDVKAVLAISATGKSTVSMIAINAECEQVAINSTDGGDSWESADVNIQWWISADGQSVVTSVGNTSLGCTPLSVSGLDSSHALALCTSGAVLGTQDSGTTWLSSGTVAGARSIAFFDRENGVAMGSTSECKSAAYITRDGGFTWSPDTCVSRDATLTTLVAVPGSTKVFGTDAQSMWQSADAGSTWNESGRIN